MSDIVVVGSCMIDFISYAPKLPIAGETVHGTTFKTGFGGKGGNQCVAAAKLGGKTALIAKLGFDSWGKDYIKALDDLKVNTKNVILMPIHPSGTAQIIVDEAGQNQIVVVAGANAELDKSDVKYAEEVVSKAKVVVCQLETSPEVALKAIEMCKGVSILNGAPALAKFDSKLLTSPSIFCVNETEASVFTGLPVDNIDQAKKAVAKLLDKGCKTVILTLGANGSLLASNENPIPVHIPSSKVKAIDTTGAGDAFIGALAYLIAEHPNLPMVKKIEISSHMAANSVTKPGTQISFPGAQDIKKFLQ